MKLKFLVPVVAIMVISVAIISCTNDKYNKLYPPPIVPPVCDTTAMSFSKDIQPILNANCTSCHVTGGVAGSTYGDFTTYSGGRQNIAKYAAGGQLVNDITNTDVSSLNHMPQHLPSLSSCNIEKITAWVNQGALNN